MKAIVLGIEKSEGTYEGIAYSNYIIYTQKDITNGVGIKTERNKVKSRILSDYLTTRGLQVSNLKGKEININYDRYGNVESLG